MPARKLTKVLPLERERPHSSGRVQQEHLGGIVKVGFLGQDCQFLCNIIRIRIRIRIRNARCLMQCVSLVMHLIILYFPSNNVGLRSKKALILTSPTSRRSSSPGLYNSFRRSRHRLCLWVGLRYIGQCRSSSSRASTDSPHRWLRW